MSMQRFRVGVGHRVERTAWRYPNADAVARPSRNHCPNHFKKKTAAVFNRATILVGSFVAAILKELVNQITVPCMHFDAVEACCFRMLDGFAKLIQNARNLRFFKSTVGGGLYPTHRSRHETRRVLPVSGIHGRRNGRRSLRERDVRETPWMPQLRKDTPPLCVHDVNDLFPPVDLRCRVHSGRPMPSATPDAELRSLSNDEPTLRCSLTVVFKHVIAGNTARLFGTGRGKRSNHDSMFQASRADFNRTE